MKVSYDVALKHGWVTPQEVPRGTKVPRKAEIEGTEQAELIARFRAKYPVLGELLIHIPNGGSRKNAYEGWRLKVQGVRAGVSDLFLPIARNGFHGLWLEFKAAPPNNAPISPGQKEWLALMQAQGYAAHLCLGVDAAMKVLDDYLV